MVGEAMEKLLSRGKSYALSLLYPRAANCLCCKDPRRAAITDCLCPPCREELKRNAVPSEACDHCLSPLSKGKKCMMCQSPCMKYIERVYAPYCYRGPVRQLIHAFKFEACDEALPLLADAMEKSLSRRDFDCIVPVPLHKKRLRQRGVNQSLLLANALSERTGIPVREALERLHYHGPQSLAGTERKKNVEGAFSAHDCEGMNILLLDDVRTSGNTAHACAKALKEAGAKSISLCVSAVVFRKGKRR